MYVSSLYYICRGVGCSVLQLKQDKMNKQGKAVLILCTTTDECNEIEIETVETIYISEGLLNKLEPPKHEVNDYYYKWVYLGTRYEQLQTLTANK